MQSATVHTVVTGQAPPRPDVAFEGPMLIEPDREALALTANLEEPVSQELPKTASLVPLAGMLGFLSLAVGTSLRMIRRRTA